MITDIEGDDADHPVGVTANGGERKRGKFAGAGTAGERVHPAGDSDDAGGTQKDRGGEGADALARLQFSEGDGADYGNQRGAAGAFEPRFRENQQARSGVDTG